MPPESTNKESNDEGLNDSTPKWLTKAYVENVLRSYENDSTIKILNMIVTPATAKGENYASIMSRIQVEYLDNNSKTAKRSLISKSSFEGDQFANQKFQPYDVFNREMFLYEKIFPKLKNLLHEVNDNEILFADLIHIDYENTCLIFEDLKEKKFETVDRLTGLTIEDAKIVLRKLAKFHAASARFNEIYPGILEKFDRGFFNKYTNEWSTYFVDTLKCCGEKLPEFNKTNEFLEYSKKIDKLLPYVMQFGKSAFHQNPNEFNCLNHGDLWSTNLMYLINEDEGSKDFVMIDFQFSFYGSPGLDLQYFFNTSLKNEIQFNFQEELLQYYYSVLRNALNKLNYSGKIPSLFEFWLQFNSKVFFALTTTCVNLAVVLNEDTADADFHTLLGTDKRAWDFKRRLFNNPKIQYVLNNMIPKFDKCGLLDIE